MNSANKRVYFLRPVGMVGPIKIGCSVSPEHRLKALSIWSPVPLELVASAPGGHRHENALHHRFANLRVHGEWFRASKALLAVIRHAQTNGVLPPLAFEPVERKKGAMARGTPETRLLAMAKSRLTSRIGRAEVRVFGYRMQMGTGRPDHIRAILAGMSGTARPLPPAAAIAALNEYIEALAARPAFVGGWSARGDAWTAYRTGPNGFGLAPTDKRAAA